MKNSKYHVLNKISGKPVNIYLNDDTLMLEELFEKKYGQKPNRSKLYKEFLKTQINEEDYKELLIKSKEICSCCEKDYRFAKVDMYFCVEKTSDKICVVCKHCAISE